MNPETADLFAKYVVPNYTRFPVCLVRGEGSYVWDDQGRRYLDFFPGWGCNLLGHCFLRKDVAQLAIKWFQQGMNAPDASEEERLALRYELAAAYEEAGDFDRAKELFTEVYGINVSYRGVSERLRALQARTGGSTGKNAFDYARDINKEQLVS